MKPVKQTKIGMEGNCFSACVASILELPLEAVPEYTEQAGGWFFRWQVWLRERGLRFRIIPWGNQGQIGYEPPAGWSIMNVKSVTLPGELHSVVAFNGQLQWNPHPEHEKGIGEVVDHYIFECLEPARMLRDAMTEADARRHSLIKKRAEQNRREGRYERAAALFALLDMNVADANPVGGEEA